MVKIEDLDGFRVVDLKKELKRRGLSSGGVKQDLIERLTESINQENDNHCNVNVFCSHYFLNSSHRQDLSRLKTSRKSSKT